MSATYFWDGERVITVPYEVTTRMALNKYENMFCVDTFHQHAHLRYGKFKPRKQGLDYPYWDRESYDNFPSEFKMHLLIMV